jgi:hypothetical protein
MADYQWEETQSYLPEPLIGRQFVEPAAKATPFRPNLAHALAPEASSSTTTHHHRPYQDQDTDDQDTTML